MKRYHRGNAAKAEEKKVSGRCRIRGQSKCRNDTKQMRTASKPMQRTHRKSRVFMLMAM